MTRVQMFAIFALAIAVALIGVPAPAQDTYPTRPITLVVPFPPGGVADLTARPLAAALERVLKQPVGVVNKQGAAGAVGMQSVAVAKPLRDATRRAVQDPGFRSAMDRSKRRSPIRMPTTFVCGGMPMRDDWPA